jgi:hypothetical protein
LRMKPEPFQLARSGCDAPAALNALTMNVCAPADEGRKSTCHCLKLYLP